MYWKNVLESVSESVNEPLKLRNAYLLAENRLMRQQINGRVQLMDSERQELAEIGAKLGKKVLGEIATVAKPDTILAWNHQFVDQKVNTSESPKSVGRPRVDKEIEALVIRMARENRSWGYDRMQGALNHLGYTISDQTVGNILKRHGIPPAPERKETVTWREFVHAHLDVLRATDFFNRELWSRLERLITLLLCVIHWARHQVYTVRMTLLQAMQRLRSLVLRSLVLRSLVLRSLDGSVCRRQRGTDMVQKRARSGVMQDGVGVLGLTPMLPRTPSNY
jgi:transposase